MFNIRKLFVNAARWFFATPAGNSVVRVVAPSSRDIRKPYRVPYPRPSRSKYMPHQGKQERLRRRIYGFAGVANMAADLGITRADALGRIDEFYSTNA